MDSIFSLVAAVFVGVFGAFGNFMVSPVHDGGDTKQLETVITTDVEGFAQQKNDTSGTRQTVGGGEAAPAQTAETAEEMEERQLIDVRRRPTAATWSGKVGENNANGNISVLTDN